MTVIAPKIRDNKIWQAVLQVVERIYPKIDALAENFPDEKWTTAVKLRNSANDSLFFTSQAVGSDLAETSIYDWTSAKKNLFSLQSMYLFASKQKFMELEPDLIVTLDKLIAEIDNCIKQSKDQIEKSRKSDMEPWLEKYRIWQKIQKP